MRIIISAGGSGGHIYPAIALIRKIKEINPQAEILFIGREKGMEKKLIKKIKIPFLAINSYWYNHNEWYKNGRIIISFIKNYFFLRKKMRQFKPDAVVGFGGHVTISVIYVASKMKIPTYIHEQNQIIGRANAFLSKYANAVLLSYEKTRGLPKKAKTIYTGNPVVENALKIKAINKKELGLSNRKKLVVITMGSQGAAKIHDYLIHHLNKLSLENYQVLYVTGTRHFHSSYQKKFTGDIIVKAYIDDLARVIKKADLVVSRAGATIISELIALRKPSILIPSPYVPQNHQFYNAQYLLKKKAAVLVAEHEIEKSIKKIDEIMQNEKKRQKMVVNLSTITVANSAQFIYDVISKR